jgi:hypothetical protein
MVQSLAVAVGIQAGDVNMKVSVHEDNLGALVLAETLPPQFTPQVSITHQDNATKEFRLCTGPY